ncbi:MAG: hypothetical protein ACIAZJ_19280 [Gimesia chilikensis]|uniref:hypothetical protein n=1 Tax=Gimesia chilikensis TaxID=2605989 RepID=UPI003789B98E
MLTQQDIPLLVAALRFWGEEMDPRNQHLLKVYAEDSTAGQEWNADDIERLRNMLKSADIRYSLVNARTTALQTKDLFTGLEEAQRSRTNSLDQVGTLLLPGPPPQD